jgi:hypothetical protein
MPRSVASDRRTGHCGAGLSGRQPLVVMMEAVDVGNGHDGPTRRGLGGAAERGIVVERAVRAPLVVVGEVVAQAAPKGAFVPDDDVVETLAADRADQALDEGVLLDDA